MQAELEELAEMSQNTTRFIRWTTSINIQEGTVVEREYAPVAGTTLSLQGMTADESGHDR